MLLYSFCKHGLQSPCFQCQPELIETEDPSPEVQSKLDEIQDPAFYLDDTGLNIFDRYRDIFKRYIEANDLESLNDAVEDYQSELASEAEYFKWSTDPSKQEVLEAIYSLNII